MWQLLLGPTFRWPFLLGILTLAGLLVALMGDQIGDAAGWLLLGIPVATAGYYIARSYSKSH